MLRLVLILSIYSFVLCQSTYIKLENSTEPPSDSTIDILVYDQESSTEVLNSAPAELRESLESHVLTGDLFEIRMTIKHNWNDEFVSRDSKSFKKLAMELDLILYSFFDNELNTDNSIPRDNFKLVNVLPSSIDGYIYVTITAEATEQVTGEVIFDKLDMQLRLKDKLYDLETTEKGFSVRGIASEDLERFERHLECDSEFCKPTPESAPSQSTTDQPPSSEDQYSDPDPTIPSKCHPNGKFHRGSTSVYIFDSQNNQKCMDSVKNRSFNEIPKKNEKTESGESDPMEPAASEMNCQTVAREASSGADDEVVVVVRKRGDKVFIEI